MFYFQKWFAMPSCGVQCDICRVCMTLATYKKLNIIQQSNISTSVFLHRNFRMMKRNKSNTNSHQNVAATILHYRFRIISHLRSDRFSWPSDINRPWGAQGGNECTCKTCTAAREKRFQRVCTVSVPGSCTGRNQPPVRHERELPIALPHFHQHYTTTIFPAAVWKNKIKWLRSFTEDNAFRCAVDTQRRQKRDRGKESKRDCDGLVGWSTNRPHCGQLTD